MITVADSKCSRCGLCADLCHESCIRLTEEGPSIDHNLCSSCTQCVAACPTRALSWNEASPVAFDRRRLPSTEQLDELYRQRRSIRRFKQVKIERSLLEEIAGYATCAPTHALNQRVIIIDEDKLIDILDQAIVANCRWIYRMAYQLKVAGILAYMLGYADEMSKARPKIEATLAMGHAFSSRPAAFIFIIGDKKTALSEASAQYALANMMYYAQLKGIGTCLWGNGPIFIDKNRSIRQRLGLGANERIYGAMFLGYPAVRFSNKIAGKSPAIQWNGASV